MPIEGMSLAIEPRYPNAAALSAIGKKPEDLGGATLRNSFIIRSKQLKILIWNELDGRLEWGKQTTVHHLDLDLAVIGASDAWGVEQEHNALMTLGTLIEHHKFKKYLLTGSFMEQSTRSGVHYLFRKLRPTVAIRAEGEHLRILCAMCMHPIGYYEGSWGGAMVPTDDLIAHLMLMRADEPMFWRRSNQHPPWAPEAGL